MRIFKLAIAILILSGAFLFSLWMMELVPAGHWGFAISVNFLFVIVFTILFDYVLSLNYVSGYFTPKEFEREGKVYKWLGVRQFMYMLKSIGWDKVIRKGQPVNNNLDSLKKIEVATRGSEAIHSFAAICVTIVILWVGWEYSLRDIHWLIIANIIFNIYPIMIQRYLRQRLDRLIKNKETLTY
jgi:hypothetical protein